MTTDTFRAIRATTNELFSAEAINSVLDAAFGTPYLSVSDVRRYMHDPNSIVLVAMDKEAIAGVGLAVTIPETDPLEYATPVDQIGKLLEYVPELKQCSAIYLHSIVVVPEYQRRGIGTYLMNEILEWSREQDADLLFVQGWKDEKGCHIEKIMKTFDFTSPGELTNCHLQESLLNPQYNCVSCGNPCYCGEVIFTKTMDSLRKSNLARNILPS